MNRHLGALALACALLTTLPVRAETLSELLNATLASGDMTKLIAALRAHKDTADRAELTGWIRQKVDAGLVPDRFAMILVATSVHDRNMDDALMYLSYYRAVVMIDSGVCQDRTSGRTLAQASVVTFSRLTSDPGVTAEQKRQAVERALRLEAATAPARRRDASLCSAGLDPSADGAAAAAPALYADDPAWRTQREAQLPQLAEALAVMNEAHAPD